MTNAVLRPIETIYRGFRFRSRLEARWAVFFDAAEIKWEYEPQKFSINGRSYLPDFWLPQLQTFVEIKPTDESGRRAIPLMQSLVAKAGKRGLLIIGSPTIDYEPHQLIRIDPYCGKGLICRGEAWRLCILCNNVGIGACDCAPSIKFLKQPAVKSPFARINHALGEAQRARFEHGEDGRPQPYLLTKPDTDVYVAGAVIETITETDGDEECEWTAVARWRREIFGDEPFEADAGTRDGRFRYSGPTVVEDHGIANEGLAEDCLCELHDSDVVFAWIDRFKTVGTLVEIGFACGRSKPIFIAFASEEFANHFYFARQLADVAIIAPDAFTAWRYFRNWQNQ